MTGPAASAGMFIVELRLSEASKTPLLDRVRLPRDLKNLSAEQLRELADELRYETISAVAATGGHLGAGLGVVELMVALHYVFDTPTDRLIWDVGQLAQLLRRQVLQVARQPDAVEQGVLEASDKRNSTMNMPADAAGPVTREPL